MDTLKNGTLMPLWLLTLKRVVLKSISAFEMESYGRVSWTEGRTNQSPPYPSTMSEISHSIIWVNQLSFFFKLCQNVSEKYHVLDMKWNKGPDHCLSMKSEQSLWEKSLRLSFMAVSPDGDSPVRMEARRPKWPISIRRSSKWTRLSFRIGYHYACVNIQFSWF